MTRITAAVLSVALATGAAACSDKSPSGPDDTSPNPPAGMVVSNALAGSSNANSAGASSSFAVSASTVAYISAVPGTFPGALSAVVRNTTRNGTLQSVQVIEGGFDPVGIEAEVGDELSLTVSMTGGGSTSMAVKVPPRRPPGVVRTNPPQGRTDVALNVQVVVVFSEPVDKSSVTSSSVALLQDGNAVNGRVQVAADGLSAEFIPGSPLQPQTTYTLIINQGIRDLDGDVLAEVSTVAFTTATATGLGTIVVTTTTTAANSSDIDSDGYGVSVNGSPARPIGVNGTITIDDWTPGMHTVTLSDVSGNCIVAGATTRQAQVLAAGITTFEFNVTCEPFAQLVGRLAFVSERDGNSEIYAINADGTGLTRLTDNAATDVDPAWSPDGKRIAFASNRGNVGSDIYAMDADGSNVVRLTVAGTYNEAPAWSPDGRKIAFSSARDGEFKIYVMNVDGDRSSPTKLGFDRGWNAHPAWSPDGTKITFVSDWRAFDFVYDLYSMNSDGSAVSALILGPFFWPNNTFYFQSAWSPDGRKIAVVVCAYAWDNCYPNSTIALVNADGSELTVLAESAGFARPTWSPDGSTIAFSSQTCRECVGSLRYVRLDRSRSGLIFSNGHSPSWRP